ncbi:MAG: transglycosylase SLT domain-containing protein [Methylococcaceae bacterium]|nr:transglycosylase SLT domain-containing protein [Methylococcaceae bacterium]
MTNAVYKPLLSIILVLTFAGCANNPSSSEDLYTSRQFPKASPIKATKPKPNAPYTAPANTPTDNPIHSNYAQRFEVQSFIQQMVHEHGFSQQYLTELFTEAQQLPSVIRLETGADHTPGPPKPHLGSWSRYRAKFLTEEHIKNGVDFWTENATAIQNASNTYGVDPEYIVGIIGVETFFGRNIGKTCVFDALTTLAFDTQRRAPYFRTELEHFLLMTREEGYQPRQLVGSWAGAMGLGQFMPSSFRRLAVDFDKNGRRDLWQPHDAIGSVAHYFSKNGWQFNSPVAEQAFGGTDKSTIDLSTYEGDEYWQTFPNFKVIKRYNNSKKYAMAVHQLAQAIKGRLSLSRSYN